MFLEKLTLRITHAAEVCLIRMTADGRLPEAQRRNYRHVFHALSSIVQGEVRLRALLCVVLCVSWSRVRRVYVARRSRACRVARCVVDMERVLCTLYLLWVCVVYVVIE